MNKTKIRFWGCRGSFPCADKNTMEFGGDTSCVEIRTSNNDLIILDMGSGLKNLGQKIINDSSYPNEINIILSHYHLDHLLGFLMFAPLFNSKYKINIYSKDSNQKTCKEVLEDLLKPEIWPVTLDMLSADISFLRLEDEPFKIGDIIISNCVHPHPNSAFSIALNIFNKKITYSTDCEHPKDELIEDVVKFANKSDVLIHDAQYTPEDLQSHIGWGHSTWESAIEVAIKSHSKKLVLFHHSPDYNDSDINDIEKKAKLNFKDVIAARQGLEITL